MRNWTKNILKLTLYTYFICCLLVIPNSMEAQPKASSSKPNIVFETTSHDYGVIFAGDNGEVVFKFKNEGKSPLIINNVVASNTNIISDIKRSITVSTNDPQKPRIVLILTGKVIRREN